MDELYYTIAEVSERLGVTYRTLHYYEEKFGLQINRDESGNRQYNEYNVHVLDSIVELKKKGMTLDSIKTMLEEKGILDISNKTDLVIIDDNVMQVKDLILNEIRQTIRDELNETKEKIDMLADENKALREEIRAYQRQEEEHFHQLDKQLVAWRESDERSWKKKKPWYKRMFQ